MRIKKISLKSHPGIGDASLSFLDEDGRPFNTVILAGSNGTGKTAFLEAIQSLAEGRLRPNNGVVTLEVQLDAADFDRLREQSKLHSGFDESVTEAVIVADTTITAWEGWNIHWQTTAGTQNSSRFIVPNEPWKNFFSSFYSEASVNFNNQPLSTVTSTTIDDPLVKFHRSGDALADQITQLVVDIRASDAEDLQVWASNNRGKGPPDSIMNPRFRRFAKAFDAMFPSKRFKGVRRDADRLLVEFEEYGRTSTIDNLSTGEKQIVFRAGFFLRYLANIKTGLVLIDEPELSLHPDWQGRILEFYQAVLSDIEGNQPQLIIATHSPFIIHGATNAKVVILEKDPKSGLVREMPKPVYPSAGGLEAVRAFNLDAFLDTTKKPLLILTEGESDALILENAWAKLRPGEPRPFDCRAALGRKNLQITLNDQELFSKLGGRSILGIFDFDEAFADWNGVWSKKTGTSNLVSRNESEGLVKKRTGLPGWALLLPVPTFRSEYASRQLAASSILSIEFLFSDEQLRAAEILEQRVLAAGQVQPHIRASEKMKFARLSRTFPPSSFEAFEVLFDRSDEILSTVT